MATRLEEIITMHVFRTHVWTRGRRGVLSLTLHPHRQHFLDMTSMRYTIGVQSIA